MNDKNKTTWVFVDETGTVSLNDKQSKYFGLGFFCTHNPEEVAKVVAKSKYNVWKILNGNVDNRAKLVNFFHATNDPNPRRKMFISDLEDCNLCKNSFIFYYYDKSKIQEAINSYPDKVKNNLALELGGELFYAEIIVSLIHHLIAVYDQKDIFLVISTLFGNGKNTDFGDFFKKQSVEILHQYQAKLTVAFTPNQNDAPSQVADYISWYIYNYLNKKDPTYYESIYNFVKPNPYKGILENQYMSDDLSIFDFTDRFVKIIKDAQKINEK